MSEGFFSFLPPEMADAMQKQRDQQIMAWEADSLAIDHLFDNLPADDLATLRALFHTLCSDESGRLAAYYEGVASTILRSKFDVCPGCGKKHDSVDDLLQEHDATGADNNGADRNQPAAEVVAPAILEEPASDGTESLFANPDEAHNPAPLSGVYVNTDEELIGQKGLIPAELVARMTEYRIDDLRDEDSGIILGFVCIDCGQRYPSIADRMLKEPDECDGCFQKAKWG